MRINGIIVGLVSVINVILADNVVLAEYPPTPLWGGATQYPVTVNMTTPADSENHPEWVFDYYYDSLHGAERYEQHEV